MDPSGSVIEGKKKRIRETREKKREGHGFSDVQKLLLKKKLRLSGLRGLLRPSSTWPLYRKALPNDVSFWRLSKE